MWNFFFAFLSAQALTRSRFLRLCLLSLLIGALLAGLIYAAVVFHAVTERSHPSHVHLHSSN